MPLRSRITIFNAALTRTGFEKTFEGSGSEEWTALDANYDEIVRAAFEEIEWAFGRSRIELTSRSVGSFGFEDAFTYPVEALHIHEVFFDDRAARDLCAPWELNAEDRHLLCNARGRRVEIGFHKTGQENSWSASFALGIQKKCEAVLKDLIEEAGEAQTKDQEAEFLMLRAGIKSGKNRNARRVWRQGRLSRANRFGAHGSSCPRTPRSRFPSGGS